MLLSKRDPVLEFNFYWTADAPNVQEVAEGGQSLLRIVEPRRIEATYETVVGTDGALSTGPCKTGSGEYFTLTMHLPQVKLMDRSHRKGIEAFMRSYFPATVQTLRCGQASRA
ncbi:hypothetical protein ABZ920_23720 [Streptomyces sp. NPDC046831]|uniref:hypothetical protein n=1 Tax=Streptomyces sp. NPDC046831 TaxID=3154805 RepID=UPI0033BFCE0B